MRVLHHTHFELVLGARDEIIKNDVKSLDDHREDLSTSGRYCLVVDVIIPCVKELLLAPERGIVPLQPSCRWREDLGVQFTRSGFWSNRGS